MNGSSVAALSLDPSIVSSATKAVRMLLRHLRGTDSVPPGRERYGPVGSVMRL
jgi:hypothetical protein